MGKARITGILGRFLQIYSGLLLIPLFVALFYSERPINFYLFGGSAALSLLSATFMVYFGDPGKPSTRDAIIATVLGWFLAVIIGALPLAYYMPILDAMFESMAGITTTGISMLLEPSRLPHSMLFWRSFLQWVGGLGILTFFIAVVRESGAISQRLFSAEAHKTDPGSIRPSLRKSVIDLWRVYGFLTSSLIGAFIMLGMSPFNAVNHAFTTLSTGGFSTSSQSLAAFNPAIQGLTILFMFIGGVNFVLMYRLLRGEMKPFLKNAEFRLYTFLFIGLTALASFELMASGNSSAVLDAAFQVAALVSSTGYSTMAITDFSSTLQVIFLAVMFVGGSLGSTAGGVKTFRLLAMIKLLKRRLKAYSLPKTALNEVKIDGEILKDGTVKTISVLFFTWLSVVFISSIGLVFMDGLAFVEAVSISVSSAGNMGPVYISGAEMVGLTAVSKVMLLFSMLAGRLEMLPLLAIFNRRIIKN